MKCWKVRKLKYSYKDKNQITFELICYDEWQQVNKIWVINFKILLWIMIGFQSIWILFLYLKLDMFEVIQSWKVLVESIVVLIIEKLNMMNSYEYEITKFLLWASHTRINNKFIIDYFINKSLKKEVKCITILSCVSKK